MVANHCILIVRGDFKSPKEIKTIFDRVYASKMHVTRLGSIDELYETVKEAFAQDPNNVGNWGPRYVLNNVRNFVRVRN